MDEFIENFNAFRDFLHQKADNYMSQEERALMNTIMEKFNELGLEDAF